MQSTSPNSHLKYLPITLAALMVAASFVSSPRPAAEGPVANALKSATSSDRAKVQRIYGALADLMNRDSGRLITTTAAWRAVYKDALQLAAGGTDFVGKYPGLDTAVEEVLAKHYPLENAPIDKPLADKIVAGLKAVEAQCE
jgi:hypothetical protein